ncbi:MAG TPA: N-acetylneuraminate synthase family protein [Nitrospira sp.]|nr:N-acetylneuraminate synthase family protein [Nitrospira sp.]
MNGKSVIIVAEMAWAHDGALDKAIRIMQAAKDAGADAIGIHVTDLPSYMVPHYGSGEGRVSAGKEHVKVFQYLKDINLSNDDWLRFSDAARAAGIALCVMPNDYASLSFCENAIKPEFYVLTAAAFVESDFIVAVAQTGRPTIFRVGGATIGEIEAALNLFRANGGGEPTLLHGFQNYPTRLEDTNIRQMRTLQEMFGVSVGLADHIDGGDPIAKAVPVLALAFGATCIEKHITWSRVEKGEDFEAALDPQDFKEFVSYIRAGEIALGKHTWGSLSPAAERYREVSRKRMVAARTIKAGAVLRREDLTFKRADVGLSPTMLESVMGRTTKSDLVENDGITLEDLL